MGASKAALILMKNSRFNRTLQFCSSWSQVKISIALNFKLEVCRIVFSALCGLRKRQNNIFLYALVRLDVLLLLQFFTHLLCRVTICLMDQDP